MCIRDSSLGDAQLFGKYHDTHINILDMYSVAGDGIYYAVNQRINHDLDVKHHEAYSVDETVDDDGDLADAESREFF